MLQKEKLKETDQYTMYNVKTLDQNKGWFIVVTRPVCFEGLTYPLNMVWLEWNRRLNCANATVWALYRGDHKESLGQKLGGYQQSTNPNTVM